MRDPEFTRWMLILHAVQGAWPKLYRRNLQIVAGKIYDRPTEWSSNRQMIPDITQNNLTLRDFCEKHDLSVDEDILREANPSVPVVRASTGRKVV